MEISEDKIKKKFKIPETKNTFEKVDKGRDLEIKYCSLEKIDLSERKQTNSHLSGINLTYSKINDVIFKKCKLNSSTFRKAELKRVIFFESNLTNSDFQSANLNRVTFNSCDLTNVDFSDAIFKEVNIKGS